MSKSFIEEAERRKNEPLDPELVPWLFDGPPFGQVLKHPLVFDVPFHSQLAWRDNDVLRVKQEELARAEADGDWYTAIWLHERPHRHRALFQQRNRMSDADYWELLGKVWCDTENLWQWGHDRRMMLSSRPGRENMLRPDEWNNLWLLCQVMSPEVTIYRGVRPGGTRMGWSWTLSLDTATWFSDRFKYTGSPGVVVQARVAKKDILAHFTRRGEAEIVVSPGKLREVREVNLT